MDENDETARPAEDGADRMKEERGRRRRIALIFLLSLLIAAAILVPAAVILTQRNGGETTPIKKQITYCRADFNSDIWKNEEYAGGKAERPVTATARDVRVETSFSDRAGALAAFEKLRALPEGGELFADYFTLLISGSDNAEAGAMSELFASDTEARVPRRFPPQKITGVSIRYIGADGDRGYAEWRVEVSIFENDGLAVDWFDERDAGAARFCLKEENGSVKIAEIHTVYTME
ncbi:MAG: hypothetical protein IJU52_02900 [Clostridia bacterium]|nr:hypothetical protein [Clostridia bacterium]